LDKTSYPLALSIFHCIYIANVPVLKLLEASQLAHDKILEGGASGPQATPLNLPLLSYILYLGRYSQKITGMFDGYNSLSKHNHIRHTKNSCCDA